MKYSYQHSIFKGTGRVSKRGRLLNLENEMQIEEYVAARNALEARLTELVSAEIKAFEARTGQKVRGIDARRPSEIIQRPLMTGVAIGRGQWVILVDAPI